VDILLLERLAPEALAWLQARHSVEILPDMPTDSGAFRKAVYQAQAVVLPRKAVVTRAFLEFAPSLKAVARMHASTDNTDLEACWERKVRVIQATTANVRSNAEYLLASLLLMFRRGIGSSLIGDRHAAIRIGRELHNSVVGIFGLAPTAHTLAVLLHALGAKLIGYDPAVHHTSQIWSRLHVQPVSLQHLMAHADAISLQVIYASRYQGFINDKVLALCKPGQVWVGISRSQLFDSEALARALVDGRIQSCMLDGAEVGFASRGTPLHELNNLFLTPRVGSHTRESLLRASWYVAHRVHETLVAPSGSGEYAASAPVGLDQADGGEAGRRDAPLFIVR
jgi:phosphoglycerate dehydrogenase-like enzyme